MAEQLKPCPVPWCQDATLPPYLAHSPALSEYFVVICAACGCNAPEKPTKAEAIAAWNKRESPDARLERIEAAAREFIHAQNNYARLRVALVTALEAQ